MNHYQLAFRILPHLRRYRPNSRYRSLSCSPGEYARWFDVGRRFL